MGILGGSILEGVSLGVFVEGIKCSVWRRLAYEGIQREERKRTTSDERRKNEPDEGGAFSKYLFACLMVVEVEFKGFLSQILM